MHTLRIGILAAGLLGAWTPALAQSVALEFHDGRVTLRAENAALRAILNEWSRVGGTRIINAERLAGPPLTLQLDAVPERQALDIILRGVAGYMLGPRRAGSAARSTVDSILLVPVSSAPRPAQAAAPPPPIFTLPPPDAAGEANDSGTDPADAGLGEPSGGGPAPQPRRNPRERAFPQVTLPQDQVTLPQDDEALSVQPEPEAPEQESPPPARPSNPFGVLPGSSRPGTITPAPQPRDAGRPAGQEP